jgi:hypothetical protein
MRMAISLRLAPARRPSSVMSASRRFLVRVVQRGSTEDGARVGERTRSRRSSWSRALGDRFETGNQKGDDGGPDRQVRAFDRELDGSLIGAQHDMLSAGGIDEDMLEARQGWKEDAFIPGGCDVGRLSHAE